MKVERMAECSPIVFFEWPLKISFTVFTVLTSYMYFLFCGVRRRNILNGNLV